MMKQRMKYYFKEVLDGYEVLLYKNLTDVEPFAKKVC